jgi:hypothetical protein
LKFFNWLIILFAVFYTLSRAVKYASVSYRSWKYFDSNMITEGNYYEKNLPTKQPTS